MAISKKKRKIREKKYHFKKSDYGFIGYLKENSGLSKSLKQDEKDLLRMLPKEKDSHFFRHRYNYMYGSVISQLNFYQRLFELLDTSPSHVNQLEQDIYRISFSEMNSTKQNFKKNLENLIKVLSKTDQLISVRLRNLQRIECIRIEEAMDSIQHDCTLASVVMAVSAVEYRLHKLMQKKSRKLYRKEFENRTLGGIIELFRKGSTAYTDAKYQKFKKVLPDKHSHLMEILNTYRIFSAHPKEEEISYQTAKSILSFSCILLVDPELSLGS